jgi:hypothetical protein
LSGRQDSNLRPPGPKPGALPDCATPRTKFCLSGLAHIPVNRTADLSECSEDRRCAPTIFSLSDPTGTRTPNRQLRRLMLYPVELSDQSHHDERKFVMSISSPSQFPTPQTPLPRNNAERGGFEPPVQNDPYDSLANYWFKPLTHLSSVFEPKNPFPPGKGMQI